MKTCFITLIGLLAVGCSSSSHESAPPTTRDAGHPVVDASETDASAEATSDVVVVNVDAPTEDTGTDTGHVLKDQDSGPTKVPPVDAGHDVALDAPTTDAVSDVAPEDVKTDAKLDAKSDVVADGPTSCSGPNGTYSYDFVQASGDCGPLQTYTSQFNFSNTLESTVPSVCYSTAKDASTTTTDVPGMSGEAANGCSAFIDANCTGSVVGADGGNETATFSNVATVVSNADGSKLTGKLTVGISDATTKAALCSSVYTFTATLTP